MRAAIYARFSSDLQSETSIEDQARLCRSRADVLRVEVDRLFSDQAVSGSTPVAARPGGRELLEAALAGRFSVLILEGLDRLSRDSVEQETIVRRLEHRGVRIVGVSDGYDSDLGARKLVRGVRGLLNELYLDDLRAKTHRGLVGQVERGFHAGGLSFGYRSVAVDGGHRLEVDAEQADVVRSIFARYAEGWSCQRIAADLNARGVRGPRGTWSVSALFGSPRKGSGVLNNELYCGRYIWNRSRWTTHPETGRRERVDRPRSEWRVEERPELRIVDKATWSAVRDRFESPRREGGGRGRGGAPTTLFAGILRCGRCGGAMVKIDARSYGCAARKDRGTSVCAGMRVRIADLEQTVVGYLAAELSSPEVVARIEAMARGIASERRGKPEAAVREAALRREIGNLVGAIAAAGTSPALSARLAETEKELGCLERSASISPLPTSIPRRVRAMLTDLTSALRRDVDSGRTAIRAAVGDLRLVEAGGELFAEFEDVADRLALAVGGAKIGRVAGACYRTRLRVSSNNTPR
jgi:site-specific DNA recombinase